MSPRAVFVIIGPVLLLSASCLELRQLLSDITPEPGGGPAPTDPTDRPPEDPTEPELVVRLSVSNPNPAVGEGLSEEVILVCELIAGEPQGVLFSFQGPTERLFIDPRTGRASFVVNEADSGQEFAFTCAATGEAQTSAPSNQQVIIPFSL